MMWTMEMFEEEGSNEPRGAQLANDLLATNCKANAGDQFVNQC